MRIRQAFTTVLVFLVLANVVYGQHLFLAGGGLTAESEFFWNKLIQSGV